MRTTTQMITYIGCMILLEFITIINSFVFNLKGATVDAERFMENAIIWMQVGKVQFVTNSEFFVQFLGILFTIFGPSEFIAAQFGLAAFGVAAIYFVKLLEELDVPAPSWAIAGFLLWPTGLTRLTTTLREPYLILFTVVICYLVVRYRRRQNLKDIGILFAVCVIAFMFHKAYAVFFLFAMIYVLFFVLKPEGPWFQSRVVLLRGVLIGGSVLVLGYIMFYASDVRGLKPLIAVLTADSDYIGQVVDYKSSREFRTTYDAAIDVSSPLAFILSVPKTFIYYMFSPFPWQVTSPVDLLASLEGLFRFGALVIFARSWFIKKDAPPQLIPMMMMILVLCFIWAAGTSNYGTASRHHLTTNWAFLAIYVVYLVRARSRVPGTVVLQQQGRRGYRTS